MKAIRLIKIDNCQSCPYHKLSESPIVSYCYCGKYKKELTDFLQEQLNAYCEKEFRYFPKWCELEVGFKK